MYQRVLAEDADTFGDVASRVGIRYTRGTGLYRLLKVRFIFFHPSHRIIY